MEVFFGTTLRSERSDADSSFFPLLSVYNGAVFKSDNRLVFVNSCNSVFDRLRI
jgi:hypothetical protein